MELLKFEIAKKISKKLGLNGIYSLLKKGKKYYDSNEYREYLKFSETYMIPFIQSLSSIKYLKDKNLINHDAIFINGLSGDFITGGHADLKNKNKNMTGGFDIRKEIILNKLIEKHFSLCIFENNYNMKIIKNNLWNEIIKGCGDLENENLDIYFLNTQNLLVDKVSM